MIPELAEALATLVNVVSGICVGLDILFFIKMIL